MKYYDLVIEASNLSGLPEFMSRANLFTLQAERDLEKALLVRQAEKTATLTTDADGVAPLPSDFLRLRNIQENGNVVIQGTDAWTETKSGSVPIYYYGKLSSLVTNGTNWLLAAEPLLYLQAVLVQAYSYHGDQRLALVAPMVEARINAIKREDKLARFGAERIDITGQM